jgi:hypothetical protein
MTGFAVQGIPIVNPINHKQALEMMKTATDRGWGKRRKLANNTYLEWRGSVDDPNSNIAIKLHNTDIVTLHPDGSMVLNSGGWRTVTTKERINRYLPHNWRLFQEKGIWYMHQIGVNHYPAKVKEAPVFKDGMMITNEGVLVGCSNPQEVRRTVALNKRINEYASTYAFKLVNGELKAPGSGDCMFCQMNIPNDHGASSDHYREHVNQKYYVPSLLINALKMFPGGLIVEAVVNAQWYDHSASVPKDWPDTAERMIRRSVARYLKFQLGLAPYTN